MLSFLHLHLSPSRFKLSLYVPPPTPSQILVQIYPSCTLATPLIALWPLHLLHFGHSTYSCEQDGCGDQRLVMANSLLTSTQAHLGEEGRTSQFCFCPSLASKRQR